MPTTDDMTRRTFVQTTLATGFALAVQPIAHATTIHTDETGLVAGAVSLTGPDGIAFLRIAPTPQPARNHFRP